MLKYYHIVQTKVNATDFSGEFNLNFEGDEVERIKNMKLGEFISTDCIYFGGLRCYVHLFPNGNKQRGYFRIYLNFDGPQLEIESFQVKMSIDCPILSLNETNTKIFSLPSDVWLVNEENDIKFKEFNDQENFSNIQCKIAFNIEMITLTNSLESFIVEKKMFMEYLNCRSPINSLGNGNLNLFVTQKEFNLEFKQVIQSGKIQIGHWNFCLELYPSGWFEEAQQFSSLFLCIQYVDSDANEMKPKEIKVWYEFTVKELDDFLWSTTQIVDAKNDSTGLGRFGLLKKRLNQFDHVHIACKIIVFE